MGSDLELSLNACLFRLNSRSDPILWNPAPHYAVIWKYVRGNEVNAMDSFELMKPFIYIRDNDAGEVYCCDLSVDLTRDLKEQGCTIVTHAYEP